MKSLEGLCVSLLGEECYAGLCQWYESILQSDADCIVFSGRRAYSVALIMERATGKFMRECTRETGKVFLTGTSVLLHCECLAQFFKTTGTLPRILLCDATVSHGRNLNRCIRDLQSRLIEILPSVNPDEVYWALERALTISVYARLQNPSLLFARYEATMQKQRVLDRKNFHYLEAKLSTLLSFAGATGVSSYSVSLESMDCEVPLVETTYRSVSQKVWVQCVESGLRIHAIFSVRIKESVLDGSLRASPFVFLPSLSRDQTSALLRSVVARIEEVFTEEKDYGFKAVEWIEGLSRLTDGRAVNEFLIFVAETVALDEFLSKSGGKWSFPEEEFERLSRNFNPSAEEWLQEFLRRVTVYPLFSFSEFEEFLRSALGSSCSLVYGLSLDTEPPDAVRIRLEDYFYEMGKEDEIGYYEATRDVKQLVRQRSCYRTSSSDEVLGRVLYGFPEDSVFYAVAWCLQMLDAGIVSVVYFSDAESVGFTQVLQAEVLSQSIRVVRYYEWFPVLIRMESYCKWKRISFKEELAGFFRSIYAGIPYAEGSMLADELAEFQQELSAQGQEFSDWAGNYVFLQEIGLYSSGFSEECISKKVSLQEKHQRDLRWYFGD